MNKVSRLVLAVFTLVSLTMAPVFATGPADKVIVKTDQQVQALSKETADKKLATYWVALAKQEMANKQWFRAENHLNKARRMDPTLAETYQLLGDLHTTFSRDWKAEKFYKKAEKLKQQKDNQ